MTRKHSSALEMRFDMKRSERIKIVRAMDLLARSVNDESILYNRWFMCGVADGDIDENTTDADLEYYTESETFAELMGCFLRCMSDANKSGGLYVDKVVSK